jgi:hypothetical protein
MSSKFTLDQPRSTGILHKEQSSYFSLTQLQVKEHPRMSMFVSLFSFAIHFQSLDYIDQEL